MTDDQERIAVLREDLDVSLQAYDQAQAETGPVEATDASRAITLRLDADGVVESVHADGGWRDRLSPAELAGAVLEAYTTAAMSRTESYVQATADATPGRARPPAPTPSARMSDELTERMREQGTEMSPESIGALGQLVDELLRSTDEAFAAVDRQLAATVTGRSSSGHVRAELGGAGDLRNLTYDEQWLETAHSFNVGRETTEAIHDGYRRTASQSVDEIADASGLARLQALTSDPEAFARHLGI